MVNTSDIGEFISSYTGEQRSRIAFLWNGEHADKFVDTNLEFRSAVIDAIANQGTSASIALLTDLLDEETSFSVEAWGAIDELADLAGKLLLQGGTDSVLTFIRCKWKSFDTEMAFAAFEIPESLRKELQEFCESQAMTSTPDQPLYEQGARYFKSLA
ncbi:hypothetical protein [Lysobacter tyrosinilyticus]